MTRNWGIRPDAPRAPGRPSLLTRLRAASPPWLLYGTALVAWCGGLAWAGWALGGD